MTGKRYGLTEEDCGDKFKDAHEKKTAARLWNAHIAPPLDEASKDAESRGVVHRLDGFGFNEIDGHRWWAWCKFWARGADRSEAEAVMLGEDLRRRLAEER